jgi:hypothetical protein
MNRKARHANWIPLAACLGAAFLLAPAARAAKLVTFERGQAMVVQGAERRGSWYYFSLEGGGEFGVPVNRVSRIEDYEAPPASVPAAPANQMVSAPGAGVPPGSVAVPLPGAGGNPVAGGQPAGAGAHPGPEIPTDPQAWRERVSMPGGPRIQQGREQMQFTPGSRRPVLPGRGRGPYQALTPGGVRVGNQQQQQQQQQQQNPPQN